MPSGEVPWPFVDYSINFREIDREKRTNGTKPLKFYFCLLILQEEISGWSLPIYILIVSGSLEEICHHCKPSRIIWRTPVMTKEHIQTMEVWFLAGNSFYYSLETGSWWLRMSSNCATTYSPTSWNCHQLRRSPSGRNLRSLPCVSTVQDALCWLMYTHTGGGVGRTHMDGGKHTQVEGHTPRSLRSGKNWNESKS